jgi:hypothetical protein
LLVTTAPAGNSDSATAGQLVPATGPTSDQFRGRDRRVPAMSVSAARDDLVGRRPQQSVTSPRLVQGVRLPLGPAFAEGGQDGDDQVNRDHDADKGADCLWNGHALTVNYST